MYIAVIDDGINEKLYNAGVLQFNIEIFPDLTIAERENYNTFLPSHGTKCAAIIKKYSADALIGSIKILNDNTKRGLEKQLVRALQWCVDNGIRLVNLSLGTIDFRDFSEVKSCIDHATSQGLIIIAACNNKNVSSNIQ
ncbi:MAG TPA: S8 family serine peptidase [Clostridia bacterium]|nr:S8 family serine peptidase [Clostridia bacterium]